MQTGMHRQMLNYVGESVIKPLECYYFQNYNILFEECILFPKININARY